jgi:ABC-2 type transport system permease protein
VLSLGLILLLGLRVANPWGFALGLLLGAVVFSLLGLAAAAMVKEVFEAMTLMNFFRFPLLFVSGVFMPLVRLPVWLLPVAYLSPLTHVVELLKWGISGEQFFFSPSIPLLATLAYLFGCWLLAEITLRQIATR